MLFLRVSIHRQSVFIFAPPAQIKKPLFSRFFFGVPFVLFPSFGLVGSRQTHIELHCQKKEKNAKKGLKEKTSRVCPAALGVGIVMCLCVTYVCMYGLGVV